MDPITETHSPQTITGLESNTQKIILKNNLVDTLPLKGKKSRVFKSLIVLLEVAIVLKRVII